MARLLQVASRILLGEVPNFWLYNPSPPSYDLTRPQAPHFPPPSLSDTVKLETTKEPVLLSPNHTALVIVDMQNLFLSPHLGAARDSPANLAKKVLVDTAIPVARKAGIRVVWLNWGIAEDELESVPPSVVKAFGFDKQRQEFVDWGALPQDNLSADVRRRTEGLGFDMGRVDLEDGTSVEAGRMLMRDTWNMQLPPDLDRIYREGRELPDKPDLWIHKNRVSGFWAGNRQAVEALKDAGIRSLLFAGTKTDACVVASLLDAWHEGFDVILLKDACGTTSPDYASEAVAFNCARIWGFVTHSSDLKKGVEQMLKAL
ncbi:Isochorismatase hydrolase [Xylaria telfairii]|nr:Isochorismatase hydrolase [Xylaria telfairii]